VASLKPAFTRTGIELLGNIPWGTHLSLFYETKQDFFDIIVPYFSAGLENKEFCLWIVPPSVSQQEALEALKRGVPDFDRHLSEGNIELASDDQWFRKGGSIIGPAAVVERFRKKLRAAISEGYVGLRANGGAVTFQKTERLSELEKQLDDLTADKKAAGASSKESARRLGISPRTVEFHRANMLRKLGAKNTADLVRVVLAA